MRQLFEAHYKPGRVLPQCLQVMAAQANFVRVRVDSLEGGEPGELPPRPRLLCVVRALLKKIKQVRLRGSECVKLVCSVQWAGGRAADAYMRGRHNACLQAGRQACTTQLAQLHFMLLQLFRTRRRCW